MSNGVRLPPHGSEMPTSAEAVDVPMSQKQELRSRGVLIGRWLDHEAYQKQRYMPVLDGLRGIAVALVITRHLHQRMWDALSGAVGVIIFFVLSGYLITRLALQEEDRSGRLNIAAFYVRRIFRICPVYYVVLAIYAGLILGLKTTPDKIAAFKMDLPYALSYSQEIPYWGLTAIPPHEVPFYQSWSLGIEEKFYLIWPLLMVAVAASRRLLRLEIISALAMVCVMQGFFTEGKTVYHLESYGFILFGGALALALSRAEGYKLFLRIGQIVIPAAIFLAGVVQFYLMPNTRLPGLTTLYAVCAVILIGALASSRGPAVRLLSNKLLVGLGRISYGVYLVHILCLNIVEKVAKPGHGRFTGVLAFCGTLLLSSAVALILHALIESPFMKLGRHWSSIIQRHSEEKATA